MTKSKKRLYGVFLLLVATAGIVFLITAALRENIVFFVTPTELQKNAKIGQKNRVGGHVLTGSIQQCGATVSFIIKDDKTQLTVIYKGVLPSLFREEQQVVIDGALSDNNTFIATRVLAKHDEVYKPQTCKG